MNRFRLLLTKKVSPSLVLQAGLRGVDVLEKEFIKIVPVVTKEIKDVIAHCEHAAQVLTASCLLTQHF